MPNPSLYERVRRCCLPTLIVITGWLMGACSTAKHAHATTQICSETASSQAQTQTSATLWSVSQTLDASLEDVLITMPAHFCLPSEDSLSAFNVITIKAKRMRVDKSRDEDIVTASQSLQHDTHSSTQTAATEVEHSRTTAPSSHPVAAICAITALLIIALFSFRYKSLHK